MRTICAALCLGFAALSAFAGGAVVTSETPQGKLELTVKTKSVRNKAGVVTFDAVLRNVTSGRILAEPRVAFKPSDGFKVSTKGENDLFTASLSSADSGHATLDVEYSIDGELVFAPRVTLELK